MREREARRRGSTNSLPAGPTRPESAGNGHGAARTIRPGLSSNPARRSNHRRSGRVGGHSGATPLRGNRISVPGPERDLATVGDCSHCPIPDTQVGHLTKRPVIAHQYCFHCSGVCSDQQIQRRQDAAPLLQGGTVNLTEIGTFWRRNQPAPEPRIRNLAPANGTGNGIRSLNLTIPCKTLKPAERRRRGEWARRRPCRRMPARRSASLPPGRGANPAR